MNPEEYDWTEFSITFYYPVPVDVAYACWATSAGLESFFIDDAAFRDAGGRRRKPDELVTAGDRYHWSWRHDFRVEGEIRSAEEDSFVEFTFGSMLCRVTFEPAAGSTAKVHLRQSAISRDAAGQVMGHLNCRSCWVFFMTNLKSVLLTGTDLRDAESDRVSSMEVGFQASR
jgi:uncharacterized protein YndB with AHSA1/START domain